MNVKLGKKLGEGLYGTVYKSQIDGAECVSKIEKYNGDTTLASTYMRQVEFDKFARQSPHLLHLVSHGVVEHCKHIQPIPAGIVGKDRERMVAKNQLKQCSVLSYTPVLDRSLKSVWFTFTDRQKLKVFTQLIEVLGTLKMAGYRHRDLHLGNIMSHGTRWYLIDYGCVVHKSWPVTRDDERIDRWGGDDIYQLLFACMANPLWDYMVKRKIKFKKDDTVIKAIVAHPRFAAIKPWLPRSRKPDVVMQSVFIATMVLDYPLYVEAMGVEAAIADPANPRFLLHAVRHSQDRDFAALLKALH